MHEINGRVVMGVALFTLVVLTEALLAQRLWAHHFFDFYDILFNIDLASRYSLLARGSGGEGLSLMHPNLWLAHVPVRVLALLAARLGLAADMAQAAHYLALLVLPVATGGTVVVVFDLLQRLGLTLWRAAGLALLLAGSFSGLLFGGITDHFALGGLSIALTFWLAERTLRSGRLRPLPWIALGMAVTSITVTNVVLFAVVLVLLVWSFPRLDAGYRRTAGVLAAAVGLSFALHLAVNYAHSGVWGLHETSYGQTQLTDFIVLSLRRVAALPLALVDTVSPAAYLTHLDGFGRLIFTFEGVGVPSPWRLLPGGLTVLLAAVGVVAGLRGSSDRTRFFVRAALAVLGCNLAFHAVWGHEYFLYSQHWLLALLLPLFVLLHPAFPGNRRVAALLPLLLALVVANNLRTLAGIMADYDDINPYYDAVAVGAAVDRGPLAALAVANPRADD